MQKTYYVYIMASKNRAIYIGMGNDFHRRCWEHKIEAREGFSRKYKTKRLVYFESFEDVRDAINREKQLKGWRRSRKVALIESKNPKWSDLSRDWYQSPSEVFRLRPSVAWATSQDDNVQTDQIKSEREWVEAKFHPKLTVLRLHSYDGMNRLSRGMLRQLLETMKIVPSDRPVVFTGNKRFFSAGADLNEIAALNGPQAYEFAKMGQSLMNAIDQFPAPVYAAIEGYCMGGGLDLALACAFRIAAPNAILGHRGAALGLITGWGGTQRLPRLIGKGRALQMFCAAEKLDAARALQVGLVDAIAEDPVQEISQRLHV
jgi:enoyl-CoA hydratase/carnithine racemase/predicted GIY-YIG superfamily endonuclease